MLFTISLLLLTAWLVGMAGVFSIGQPIHVFLLVGLMLLFLAFLKARDAAGSKP